MGRILVAVAIIGAALFMYITAGSYPGAARRLPQLLAVVVMLLGVFAVVQAVIGLYRARADDKPLLRLPDWRRVAIGVAFVAFVFAYAWSIPHLGYLIATPLMLAVPLAALRPVGWPAMGITVVAVTGVIWFIFVWFLQLPIPLYPGA